MLQTQCIGLTTSDRRQEMSQRDPGGPVQLVIQRAEANLRQLMHIPDNYKVLFFQVSDPFCPF